jgi:hypothetical protein
MYVITTTWTWALIEENPTFPELELLEVGGTSHSAFEGVDDDNTARGQHPRLLNQSHTFCCGEAFVLSQTGVHF